MCGVCRKIPLCSDSGVPSEQKESICGRPLGVRFNRKTGELFIADAYMGLMKVGPDGGEAQVLATEADGVPFHFLNGLDVDQATGDVYFTDSSANYPRRYPTRPITPQFFRDMHINSIHFIMHATNISVCAGSTPRSS
jgi:hypothetical protein